MDPFYLKQWPNWFDMALQERLETYMVYKNTLTSEERNEFYSKCHNPSWYMREFGVSKLWVNKAIKEYKLMRHKVPGRHTIYRNGHQEYVYYEDDLVPVLGKVITRKVTALVAADKLLRYTLKHNDGLKDRLKEIINDTDKM